MLFIMNRESESLTVHAAVLGVLLYVPAVQTVHTAPLSPVYPTLHPQLVLPPQIVHNEPEFTGHAKHGVDPVVFLYQEGPHR